MTLFRRAAWLSAWLIVAPMLSAGILADSTADFSGIQGSRNWYYGYFPNGDPHSFTQFPYFNAQTNTWQQATCCPPFTQVGANSFSQPNGTNNGQEQWAVREWLSTFSGPIFVRGRLSKVDISYTSTGVYGRVFLNHQQMAITPLVADYNGVDYSVSLTVAVGDVIDIPLAPNGPDNNDLSCLSATISSTDNTVEVDFSKPLQVHSASGFLFGIQLQPDQSPGSGPPQSTITPLNPAHWRTYTSPAWYQRVQAAAPNVPIDFIMMNIWGPAINDYDLNGPPWLNFPAYEAMLQSAVAPLNPVPADVFFEPWVEPDDGFSPYFQPGPGSGYQHNWSGTAQQFFDTYWHAFHAVRAALGPAAQMEGPDFGLYDRVSIQQFLEYCLANGCEVNELSWHALSDESPDSAFITAKDARASFLENPRYAPLKIQRLVIGEMVGAYYILQPAGTLAFYQQFELGGADEGNRACWPDPHTGADNCATGTLDGLLTQGTFQPRSVWYAHWAYADGVASRVQSAVSDPNIVALASSSAASVAAPQILLGFVDFPVFFSNGTESRNFHLTLRHVDSLPGMASATNLILRVERIPDTEESPLAQLQPVADMPVTVSGGVIDVNLPAITLGDVDRIRLLNPSTPVPTISAVTDQAAGSASLTPGMPIQVTGTGFGSSATDGAVVTIGNEIAPILTFIDSTRLVAQAPVDTPLGTMALTVTYRGQASTPFKINLAALAPEIEPPQTNGSSFYDSSGTAITAAHPAIPGAEVYCLAIGLGTTNPPQVTKASAGTQAPTTAAVQVMVGNETVQPDYAGLFAGGTPGYYQVSFKVPPDAAAGNQPVSLKVGGIASNTQMLVVGPPVPFITTQGVVPGTVQSGEWVSIYGVNLAGGTATWAGDFPTILGGASVTIGGQAAYLSYVSPGQINAQVPNVASMGSMSLTITSGAGSGSSTVTLASSGPYFFLLDGKHVAGIILRKGGGGAYGGGSYDILGPTGTSLGYPTVAAAAGDVVELFGTGFGPTNPTVPAGQAFSGAAPATTPITIRIGNASITPAFAGLSGPGLFQFNLTIPSGLGTGDAPLAAIVGGVQTPAGSVISLR